MAIPTSTAEIEYPTGDGQPMAETPIHRENMTDTIACLQRWYADNPEVYISGNMFVYYVEGKPKRCLAPDTFVALGVPNIERDAYFTWREPKTSLDFVAEFTSKSTKQEDLEEKFEIYRDEFHVREYLLFGPYQEYLDPPEQLWRLSRGKYTRVRPVKGRLPSKVLGLHLEREGKKLRLFDPNTQEWLPTPEEIAAERDDLAAEVRRLNRELRRLKRGHSGNNKTNHRKRKKP